MTEARRITGRQLVAVVAMISAAIVLAPVGAVAASSVFTSIADPVHPSYKARVTAKGGLAVTTQDGATGVRAKVDRSGHAVVGDGSGALTVDGSVRGYAPAATWHFSTEFSSTYYDLTGPRSDAVNLTSLFVGGDHSTQFVFAAIYAATVPGTTKTGCQEAATSSKVLWQGETGGPAYAPVPVSASFPTPLTARPGPGKKTCLYAYVNHVGGAILDASGYFGG